jgi:hypothetical protein
MEKEIEKMKTAIERKMPEIKKLALFADESQQHSYPVRLAYRVSDDTLLVERVQEGSRTDVADKMNAIDFSFYIQGKTLYDIVDPSSTLPYEEQWDEAMESGDYVNALNSQIAEGIEEFYREYNVTRSVNTEKKLYFVENGEVSEVGSIVPDTDDINTILVLASNPADALRIAKLYDLGQLQIDNCVYMGETIACVSED